MPSVIVAAHNEERVIGACLDRLLSEGLAPTDIVVVPNGCSDRTAEEARARGVAVVERAEAGKADAINAGERAAHGFPRIYLDADIVVPRGTIAAVVAAFAADPRVLAVAPRRGTATAGRPWPVRAYFAINSRLPAFRGSLFGRGLFALSHAGRQRFGEFPALVADDLFADAVFAAHEKAEVPGVTIEVEAPRTTAALLARLVRVRQGNGELRTAAARLGIVVQPADRWSWLRVVVLPRPRLWPAAVPYAVLTILAGRRAQRAGATAIAWGRDDSTRTGLRAA